MKYNNMKLINLIILLLTACSSQTDPNINRPQVITSQAYSDLDVIAELHNAPHWYQTDYILIKVINKDVEFVLIPQVSSKDNIIYGKDLINEFNLIIPSADRSIRYIKDNQVYFAKITTKE